MSEAPQPRLMAWEITRSCNLACAHCRAAALRHPYTDELTTEECYRLLDQVSDIGRPIIILTGGEPLLRRDIFDIAAYGIEQGLRVVLATNGVLVTPEVARRLAMVGIPRISVSIDFPNATEHDLFRGKAGSFQAALDGIRAARDAGVQVQINSTITKSNVACLEDLLALALEVGAVAFHPFMLVPTGRGKELESEELAPIEYEKTLHWIYDKSKEMGDRIFFKPTDVPHYMRVVSQREAVAPVNPSSHQQTDSIKAPTHAIRGHSIGGSPRGGRPVRHAGGMESITRGCLAGSGFFFVSHTGIVQGCGYLEVPAGNIRQQPLAEIWRTSPLFTELRDFSRLKGKCGRCEYRDVCGGCRARAYGATGDYLAEEPYCIHQPRRMG